MTQIHTPVRARTNQMLQKLTKYKVNTNLMDKSIHFDKYDSINGNYTKMIKQNIANQFYAASKKNFYFSAKMRH